MKKRYFESTVKTSVRLNMDYAGKRTIKVNFQYFWLEHWVEGKVIYGDGER